MKKELIILLVLGVILLSILKFRRMKSQKEYEKDFESGLRHLKDKFNISKNEAEKLEQQYRLETAHFKSGQFKNTLSAGMEKFGNRFPYGWISLNKYFWKLYPEHAPMKSKFYTGIEGGTGKKKTFLSFKNINDAMATMLMNARMKGGKFEAWYSNNEDAQKRYLNKLNSIKPRIVNNVYNT